jgi:hypothetical protein
LEIFACALESTVYNNSAFQSQGEDLKSTKLPPLNSNKYQRTTHPNVYVYEGKHRASYLTFFKGRQVTLRTFDEAVAAHSKMQLYGRDVLIGQVGEKRGIDTINIKSILKQLRSRSKAANIGMHLTESDIITMRDRSNGFCELTGIQFSDKKPDGKRFRPWMPSIDRIDCASPYQINNCRIVTAYANIAINDLGEEEFYRLAMMFIKAKRAREKRGEIVKSENTLQNVDNFTYPQLVTV